MQDWPFRGHDHRLDCVRLKLEMELAVGTWDPILVFGSLSNLEEFAWKEYKFNMEYSNQVNVVTWDTLLSR